MCKCTRDMQGQQYRKVSRDKQCQQWTNVMPGTGNANNAGGFWIWQLSFCSHGKKQGSEIDNANVMWLKCVRDVAYLPLLAQTRSVFVWFVLGLLNSRDQRSHVDTPSLLALPVSRTDVSSLLALPVPGWLNISSLLALPVPARTNISSLLALPVPD